MWLILGAVLVVLAAGLVTLAWAGQRSLIYLPDTSPAGPAADFVAEAEDLTLHTDDGLELGAWFIPAAPDTDTGAAVLVANGNGGNRESRAVFATAARAAGLSVLLFDYRGYGGNPGSPSEQGLALDVRAARRALVEDLSFAEDRVLYFGESLGTGVVTELALEHPPAGLLLRSPYTSLVDLGRVHYPFLPVRALLRDRYPTIDRIGEVTAPTAVVYGTDDAIVPPEQSRRVAEAAGGLVNEVVLHGAGHNDPQMFTGAALLDALVDLAERPG